MISVDVKYIAGSTLMLMYDTKATFMSVKFNFNNIL